MNLYEVAACIFAENSCAVLVTFLQPGVPLVCVSHAEKALISNGPTQFPQSLPWEFRCLF